LGEEYLFGQQTKEIQITMSNQSSTNLMNQQGYVQWDPGYAWRDPFSVFRIQGIKNGKLLRDGV
jgi:hypothetical protein